MHASIPVIKENILSIMMIQLFKLCLIEQMIKHEIFPHPSSISIFQTQCESLLFTTTVMLVIVQNNVSLNNAGFCCTVYKGFCYVCMTIWQEQLTQPLHPQNSCCNNVQCSSMAQKSNTMDLLVARIARHIVFFLKCVNHPAK